MKELAFTNIIHIISHHRILEKKLKMEKRVWLTSDVVNCDDAGGQHFSRGTKSPVPELLVGADAWGKSHKLIVHMRASVLS